MKSLYDYITEATGEKITFDKVDRDFTNRMENNCRNENFPPFRELLGGGKLFNRFYTDQCYLYTNADAGTITFVDRADFTTHITFKIAKPKLKSGNAITPDDLKRVVEKPASWGYLNKYSEEECVNACRALTCVIYNHIIGKDIDIPGIE